jgi:hypothetical protein
MSVSFRQLLRGGYHHAADRLARGSRGPTPPIFGYCHRFFAVDQVLTRSCTATAIRILSISGSDHRALVTDIVVQRGQPLHGKQQLSLLQLTTLVLLRHRNVL